jgi:hypothetical protein
MIKWAMTSFIETRPTSSEDIKSELKVRLVRRVDELFARLPEGSSVAEIEKALLKESPELTSEMFQALVPPLNFPLGRNTAQIQGNKEADGGKVRLSIIGVRLKSGYNACKIKKASTAKCM